MHSRYSQQVCQPVSSVQLLQFVIQSRLFSQQKRRQERSPLLAEIHVKGVLHLCPEGRQSVHQPIAFPCEPDLLRVDNSFYIHAAVIPGNVKAPGIRTLIRLLQYSRNLNISSRQNLRGVSPCVILNNQPPSPCVILNTQPPSPCVSDFAGEGDGFAVEEFGGSAEVQAHAAQGEAGGKATKKQQNVAIL